MTATDQSPLLTERAAGVILHPTSLPGSPGCGTLGPDAFRFVDLIADAAQTWWQILPLSPPGPAGSPYAARSAFAGWPALISAEGLVDMGLLSSSESLAGTSAPGPSSRADFRLAWASRDRVLRIAFSRLPGSGFEDAVEEFRAGASWVDEYALFAALKDRDERSWVDWGTQITRRDPSALREARRELDGEVRYQIFLQWLFERQWLSLREYAAGRGVRIMGDIPIFVDHDSADVWAHRDVFRLAADGRCEVVTGVPPDYFSETGQRWGNPHYRWDHLEAAGYGWWIERFKRVFSLFDAVRIDHFRGFAAAWEIPADSPVAVEGEWIRGPGRDLFDAAHDALGPIAIVAEDLGIITPDVEELRDDLGYPGMKVLQFAFDSGPTNPYLPHNYSRESVVYTGTHDNDTTLGWWQALAPNVKEDVLRYVARDGSDIVHDLVRIAYASVANQAIVPMQDVLNLGSEARMNFPGRLRGNWTWRFAWDQVSAARLEWLADAARTYGRAERPGEAGKAHSSG